MKIGIISDTHDQVERTTAAIALLQAQGVEFILHCGDITEPMMIPLFTEVPTHFVWGNCDYQRIGMAEQMRAIGSELHEPFGEMNIEGIDLAWIHGDDKRLYAGLVHGDGYDFIFHGHTHVAGESKVGRTRIINPGAMTRAERKTVAVLELPRGELQWLRVEM